MMMSQCTICYTPTDLALSDVLTDKEVAQVGGPEKVPFIGTCGERECLDKQLDRLRAALPHVTVVVLIAREDLAPLSERTAVHVLAGDLDEEAALLRLADDFTAAEYAHHNEHYVADAENGPCEDDIPVTWTPEFIRTINYVIIERSPVA